MSAATSAAVTLPLAGRRILVTRAREQAGGLSRHLAACGAEPVELPLIEIVPAPSEPIDEAIRRISNYDWVVFTSVNGVRAFFERVEALGCRGDVLGDAQVAAIGRATAGALEAHGARVDFVPEAFVAEAVVGGLVARGVTGMRVLLPRAAIARDTLPEGLRAAGATVDVVVAYLTRPVADIDPALLDDIRAERLDAITLASPSAVRALATLLGDWRPRRTLVACIGPITARAARDAGFAVGVEAAEYSVPGLVNALVERVSVGHATGR